MPSQGEDLAVLSLCNHSIIGVRRVRKVGKVDLGKTWAHVLTLNGGGVLKDVGVKCMCSVVYSRILGYRGKCTALQ